MTHTKDEALALAQEATQIATWLWKNFYKGKAPQWEVLPDIRGVLSQIDNMVAGLKYDTPAQPAPTVQEPVEAEDTLFRQFMSEAEKAGITHWPTPPAVPVQEPYGQVTVVKRPGCVDQHWFYRWPDQPYLDNAAECHVVYTTPPAAQPAVPLNELIAALMEASESLSDSARGPLADELYGFALMLAAAPAKGQP